MIPFCVAIMPRIISQVKSWFCFVLPCYFQNHLNNINLTFPVGCHFVWKLESASNILSMIDDCHKSLRNKTQATFKKQRNYSVNFYRREK